MTLNSSFFIRSVVSVQVCTVKRLFNSQEMWVIVGQQFQEVTVPLVRAMSYLPPQSVKGNSDGVVSVFVSLFNVQINSIMKFLNCL